MQTLHFPSKETIIGYLQQHPLTKDPYLTEKKIIHAVADFFADEEKFSLGVDMGVMLTMSDLNQKLQLPTPGLIVINMNLTQALKDCANQKQIKLEKK